MAAPYKGFFELRTPKDLLGKAHRDFARLTENPTDQDAAFDFFVTARHVPDWLAANGGEPAATLFSQYVELRVCRHIADGAKHFEATNPAHKQIQKTHATPGGFQSSAFSSSFQVGQLTITLDSADIATLPLGPTVNVIEMAKLVLKVLDGVVVP